MCDVKGGVEGIYFSVTEMKSCSLGLKLRSNNLRIEALRTWLETWMQRLKTYLWLGKQWLSPTSGVWVCVCGCASAEADVWDEECVVTQGDFKE